LVLKKGRKRSTKAEKRRGSKDRGVKDITSKEMGDAVGNERGKTKKKVEKT